jgi:hypothetical protein
MEMPLKLYSPDMLPEVMAMTREAYQEISRDRYGMLDAAEICGQPVCHTAARLMVCALIEEGIAAYREEHSGHFLTVMTQPGRQASPDDTIVCLTWAQWHKRAQNMTSAKEIVAWAGKTHSPAYIGRRDEIRHLLPAGIYHVQYGAKSVLSRAGAFSLVPEEGEGGQVRYKWDAEAPIYEEVGSAS